MASSTLIRRWTDRPGGRLLLGPVWPARQVCT